MSKTQYHYSFDSDLIHIFDIYLLRTCTAAPMMVNDVAHAL